MWSFSFKESFQVIQAGLIGVSAVGEGKDVFTPKLLQYFSVSALEVEEVISRVLVSFNVSRSRVPLLPYKIYFLKIIMDYSGFWCFK